MYHVTRCGFEVLGELDLAMDRKSDSGCLSDYDDMLLQARRRLIRALVLGVV